ncbi:hypothetical protein JIN84_21275 [Luteolibacter yonseiensis]|uniref:Uncharacterized protein n=1 Tax=Luteolibacter yonseiensis TaxID=1144680 RepID=A0A934VE22_9BACT|nr:hypothetical protein [Luteolibacter yonseiensis]MBK1818169.1 hypothetical protein [Luteolibacter yonseiensis]
MLHPLPTLRQAAEITVAFALSTLITALFIRVYGGYVSQETMILSGSIAGGKWAIQILLGWLLLGAKRWIYIRELGIACLIGSLVLIPFSITSGAALYFFGSLLASICAMGTTVVIRLKAAGFAWRWPALWFLLLSVAVTLQLTIVFHIL